MAISSRKRQSNGISTQVEISIPRRDARRAVLLGLLLSVALNTAGQILFKVARSAQPDASLFAIFSSVQTWIAFIVYGLSAVSWLWVLARAQLAFAYPILALTVPIVVTFSMFLFAEPVSLVRWIGVAVVVVGVALLART